MSGQPLSGPGPADLAEIRAVWIDFYDAHYHRVVRFVMHCGAGLLDAQDAAHEAFAESWALVNRDSGQLWLAITDKEAWIRTVARRRHRRPPGPRIRPPLAEDAVIPDLADPRPGPGELTVQTQAVLQALRSLKDEEVRAVMAFCLDGFSTEEIARTMKLTKQRVRDLKKRGRATLKTTLAGQMSPGRRQPR